MTEIKFTFGLLAISYGEQPLGIALVIAGVRVFAQPVAAFAAGRGKVRS